MPQNENAKEIMEYLRVAITDAVEKFGLSPVFNAMIPVCGNFIMATAEGAKKDEFGVVKMFIEGVTERVTEIHRARHPNE